MRVFISYRREISEHLAWLISKSLAERVPSLKVFVDVASIPPGASFLDVIQMEITGCDIVIAIIGPGWTSERLKDSEDVVRLELETAAAQQKRVVPILHGGARFPTMAELPAELAWLRERNAITFGMAPQLDEDMERLVAGLTGRESALEEAQREVRDFYTQKDTSALQDAVEDLWESNRHKASPASADAYRTLAVALQRDGYGQDRIVWMVRGLAAAYKAQAPNAFALGLLPFFFELIDVDRGDDAREVLSEIAGLIDPSDPSQVPSGHHMTRVYHEKLAFSYWKDQLFEQALPAYAAAIEIAGSSGRGQLKSRGGLALCLYQTGDIDAAIAETTEVETKARQQGWLDIADPAKANLHTMRTGNGELEPYEVT